MVNFVRDTAMPCSPARCVCVVEHAKVRGKDGSHQVPRCVRMSSTESIDDGEASLKWNCGLRKKEVQRLCQSSSWMGSAPVALIERSNPSKSRCSTTEVGSEEHTSELQS